MYSFPLYMKISIYLYDLFIIFLLAGCEFHWEKSTKHAKYCGDVLFMIYENVPEGTGSKASHKL